jgi:hypothetical protein
MTVKKSYKVGDTVWIYGINRSNVKPSQGRVIKAIDLNDAGYTTGPHYIIEIPTPIEPLLEVRTWHNISQDEKGPVGSFRELKSSVEPAIKFAGTLGFVFDDDPNSDTTLDEKEFGDDDEIDPNIIHAALEKSQKDVLHAPLNLKTESPKKRYYKRKPKA